MRRDGFADISDYALVSDQRTAALIAKDGRVDWMCAPRFDDEPLFGALLDPEDAGVCELAPTEPFETERCYLEDTNVLRTTWRTASGVVTVTDALAVSREIQRFSQLIRRVECTSGEVELAWRVRPRFGWARAVPKVRREEAGHVLGHGSIEMLVQAFDCGEMQAGDGEVFGRFRPAQGDSGLLSMLFTHDFPLLGSRREQDERRLEETIGFWRSWLRPLAYEGPWEPAVRRSALALAACTHNETGAMVAAPTTSLPERVGGDRNYDYRFCWVRDTSFALDASLGLGLHQQAQATLGWLLRASRRTHPRVTVFFTLDGDPFYPQTELDVPGWRGSRPALAGNDAGGQLQLGCYSELMETAWLFVDSGSPLDEYSGLHLGEIADHICHIWRNPDSGIWELEDHRNYTGSKIGCWTALDRALRLHAAGQLRSGDPGRWRRDMAEIERWVRERCIVDGVLVRDGDGGDELDCTTLLSAHRGFIEHDDPVYLRTIDRIRSELGAGGPLLYRYSGQQDQEGAFLACSFWLVEGLAQAGRADEAAELMDQLVGYGNDVGLLSEEIDPSDASLLGNFPQVLSHLALLSAATTLSRSAR